VTHVTIKRNFGNHVLLFLGIVLIGFSLGHASISPSKKISTLQISEI